jgi:hypothetical protein
MSSADPSSAQTVDRVPEQALGPAIAQRVRGKPADGTTLPISVPSGGPPMKVIWVDGGDEVLVHLDSIRARVLDRTLLISIDLETDQTGRTPLVCVFATGAPGDPAGLVTVTDELPRGNGLLAARWGTIVQAALWAGLLAMATDTARTHNLAPASIVATIGVLVFESAGEISIPTGAKL